MGSCSYCTNAPEGVRCSDLTVAAGCTFYRPDRPMRHAMASANDRKPLEPIAVRIGRREQGGLDGFGTRRTLHPQMRERTRIYFAHPMIDYDTVRESQAIATIIHELGPEVDVINPNLPEHQASYEARGDFAYWTDLARSCGVVVYMAMPNEWIGSGVWKEVDAALRAGRRVYEVPREPGGLLRIEHLDVERCLSVEETKRTTRMFLAWKKGL